MSLYARSTLYLQINYFCQSSYVFLNMGGGGGVANAETKPLHYSSKAAALITFLTISPNSGFFFK